MVLWLMLACGGAPTTTSAPVVSHPTAPTALAATSNVDVDGLKAALPAKVKLIDVRTVEEFASGHVPGAVNIPIDVLDPQDVIQAEAFGDKSKPVYVICESGGRSARAATMLASAGYAPVDVTGGTGAWRAKGYPLDK